jgi:hypothetical protein
MPLALRRSFQKKLMDDALGGTSLAGESTDNATLYLIAIDAVMTGARSQFLI